MWYIEWIKCRTSRDREDSSVSEFVKGQYVDYPMGSQKLRAILRLSV